MDVPSTEPFDVFYNKFKALKIKSSHGIEGYIEKDECPFEEGVDGVGCD